MFKGLEDFQELRRYISTVNWDSDYYFFTVYNISQIINLKWSRYMSVRFSEDVILLGGGLRKGG